jgi:hypothetical protein
VKEVFDNEELYGATGDFRKFEQDDEFDDLYDEDVNKWNDLNDARFEDALKADDTWNDEEELESWDDLDDLELDDPEADFEELKDDWEDDDDWDDSSGLFEDEVII